VKKLLFVAAALLLTFSACRAEAFELEFRLGPAFNAKDWAVDATQFKLGLNFAATSKGAESGFYSSTTIDLSLLKDTTIVWLTPEFQYDIKLGGMPLYLYPKLGLDMFFAWYPGGFKGFGFGLKPAFGAKFDLGESFFIWAEPLGLNIILAQYAWGPGISGVPGIADGVWDTDARIVYDLMFGIGVRL
jgi:hypothetical protein